MIGGIFETIGQTLGVGKKKYFLELDDAADNSVKAIKKTATKAVETAKEASADVVEKVSDVAETATDQAQSVAQEAKAAAESGKEQAKQVATKVEKSAAKADKAIKQAAEEKAAPAKGKQAAPAKGKQATPAKDKQAAPAKAAKPAASAAVDPEQLIVNAIAAGGRKIDDSGNVVAGATSFASDFLMPQGNLSRRRPGPSLGKFKGMAKDVNPRLKG